MQARRALTAAAIAVVFTVAGCGGDEGGGDPPSKTSKSSAPAKEDKDDKGEESQEPEAPAEQAVLAQVTGGNDITLTITSAVRDKGGFLTVEGRVKNGSGRSFVPASWSGDEKELVQNGASMAGATVVDKAGKKRYLILRDTGGACLCTRFKGAFQAGEEKTFYAQFPAPPETTTTVDFQIADLPPATIELSEGE